MFSKSFAFNKVKELIFKNRIDSFETIIQYLKLNIKLDLKLSNN